MNQRYSRSPQGHAESALLLSQASPGRSPSLWDSLNSLTAPVCLIAGQKDQKYVELATKLERRIMSQTKSKQHGLTHIVQNSGHAVHLERPEEVRSILHHFLSD